MAFTYTTGATNTPYTITFNENTECDILVVGGGGGGGKDTGGGGGAGGYYYQTGLILNGLQNIKVGKGGAGTFSSSSTGGNGQASEFNSIITQGGRGGASDHS